MELSLRAYVWTRTMVLSLVDRNEAGEGVISTALAVLIMATLGALMWVGFKAMWNNTSSQTDSQITKIGQ